MARAVVWRPCGDALKFRCPYQASVMKTLDAASSKTGMSQGQSPDIGAIIVVSQTV